MTKWYTKVGCASENLTVEMLLWAMKSFLLAKMIYVESKHANSCSPG